MPSTSSSSNSESSSPQCTSNTVKPLFNNNNQFCIESLKSAHSTSSSISINSNHISNKTVNNNNNDKILGNLDGEEYEVYEF